MEIYNIEKLAVLQLKRIRNAMMDGNNDMYAVAFVANGYVTLEGGQCTAHWNSGVSEILNINDLNNLIDMAIDAINSLVAEANDLEYVSL